MRPAHLHFLIYKPGYKTHISQVYLPDDPNIETDVQFGVTRRLLGNYVRHENEKPPAPGVKGPVVLARLHVCHGAWHGQLPRAADPGQGHQPRNAAAGAEGDDPRCRHWPSDPVEAHLLVNPTPIAFRVNGKFFASESGSCMEPIRNLRTKRDH